MYQKKSFLSWFMANVSEETRSPSPPVLDSARQREDGFWEGPDGLLVSVSASDVERYTYCPMSWYLSKEGNAGVGQAISEGVELHERRHQEITAFQGHKHETTRNLIIWEWWFAIIVVLIVDTLLFSYANDLNIQTTDLSKLLALWSFSFLLVGLGSIALPWRTWVNIDPPPPRFQRKLATVPSYFEPEDFSGGWFKGGRVEALLLLSAIVLAIHSVALLFASNREQAAYVLAVTTIGWTMATTVRLQRALVAYNDAMLLAEKTNLSMNDHVAYSDGDENSGLLRDEATGLRGKPDQIVIIDGEFIPVEQKTGKVPHKPHQSHVMQLLSYTHLVEATTNKPPPYGILRYGPDALHKIDWDEEARDDLFTTVKTIQEVMAQGGAKRNHDRVGKCRHCSRRYACPDALSKAQ